ncbi:MAG: hypothetical protein NTW19_15425 [Planctomycetota bacterium]|nr:hypothetical protein [Planctomycetota bacterium]
MGYLLKQSSTARPLLFLMVDAGDHLAGKTGLSPDVQLSKNGGTFAAPAGAVSEIGNGWYKVAGHATDTATLGVLALRATASGADPTDALFEVVAFDPADAVRLGLGALPNAAAAASGGLPTLGTGSGQVNPSGGSVSVFDLSAGALAKFFTSNSGTTYASAVAGSVVQEIAANASGGGSGGGGTTDWSSGERSQIRYRLGLDGTATAPSSASPTLPVQVASIATGAVTAGALASGAVTASSIAAGALTSTSFASGAVTSSAIAAGAVTASTFAANAIDAGALASSAVNEIRDAILNQTVDGLTLESLLAALLAATVGVTEVVGNTVAFKRQDGSTTKVTITYGSSPGQRESSAVS